MKITHYLLLAIGVFGTIFAQAQIQVSSQSICQGQSVQLSSIANQSAPYYSWNFDSLQLGSLSSSTANPVFNKPCGDGPSNAYIWIGATPSQLRSIETPVLNVDSTTDLTIEFWMRYGRQPNAGYCEDPDTQDEGVHLQYKTNNTYGWKDLPGSVIPLGTNLTQGPYTNATTTPGSGGYWAPISTGAAQLVSTLYHWHKYKCILPDTALASGLQIRWAQLSTSSTGYDAWGLDEIVINSNLVIQNYIWKDEAGNVLGTNSNHTLTPAQSQWVYLETSNASGTVSFIDSVYITVNPKPYLNLGGSDTICKNDHKVLDAGYGFASYIWSTGDTNQTLVAMYPNFFVGNNVLSVCVTDYNGCWACDTIILTIEDCTGISDIEQKPDCKIYPNPAEDQVQIEVDGLEDGTYTLQWISASGALVKESSIMVSDMQLNERIKLDNMAGGIYQLNLQGEKQFFTLGKVIIK